MDRPPPPPWTYAARAAYFADQVCSFCQRHNPAGARFCNGCGSPLHLKPCSQCDAVNDQAATTCYRCGAEYSTASATSSDPPAGADGPMPAWATPADAGVARRAGWRALISDRLLLPVMATILIAGAYASYRINAAKSDAKEVAGQAIGVGEYNAPIAEPAPPLASELSPVESETTAELQEPAPTPSPEASKRAGARQRPAPALHAHVGAVPPVTHRPAGVSLGSPVADPAKARQPDPWHAMHASLARCSGDLFDRILCDQRVRQSFCEGHWGETPECANGVTNDHGK